MYIRTRYQQVDTRKRKRQYSVNENKKLSLLFRN